MPTEPQKENKKEMDKLVETIGEDDEIDDPEDEDVEGS